MSFATTTLLSLSLLAPVWLVAATDDDRGSAPRRVFGEDEGASWDGKRRVAHEWGTFTSVQGSDGVTLGGLFAAVDVVVGELADEGELLLGPRREVAGAGAETGEAEEAVEPEPLFLPFHTLDKDSHELNTWGINRSGRHRVLFHQAWIQPVSDRAGALPIVLDRSGNEAEWPLWQGSHR